MTALGATPPARSTGRLAAGRSVEEDPDGEVRGEILEPVRLAGGGEQERAGLNGVAIHAVKEPTSPAGDDVHLVPVVWPLRVVAVRRVQLDRQRPVAERRDGQVARRRWSQGEGVGQAHVRGPGG